MGTQQTLPFRKWVPHWLGIVASFVVLIPILMINGAFTGSSIDISGTLGVLSEDITMAYYATSAGMASAYPLIGKIRPVITTKTIILCDLILQVFLCFICAKTSHIEVITVCCFFIGFLKAFVMIELIVVLRPVFSPANVRSEFYSYFYPIVFTLSQCATVLTALFAYNYNWQHMYYFTILLLLLAIITVLMLFRYGRRPIRIPFRDVDWLSFLLIALTMLLIIYAATYGKTKDWFSSASITTALGLVPFLGWWFVYRQKHSKAPYLRLEVLNGWKPVVGYLFMAIVMFLSASSALVSSYSNTVLRLNSVHTNKLSLWLIPGFVIGAFVSYWWFRTQRFRFRVLVFWGMACFVIYLAFLYFGLTPTGTYEFLYLPMVFRGAGMMILFIAFGVFAVEGMDPKLMIYNAFFLIGIRSAIAPALSGAFFSNALYRLQQQGITVLSETITMENPVSATRYTQALQNALLQGNSMEDAVQLATNSLYQVVQIQSLMVAIKTITGYLLIFAILLMIVSRFTPFHKTRKVKVVKTGNDMV